MRWQKLMAVEDMTEEERRETHEKLEMLQSVVRTFELKAKNAQDHSKLKALLNGFWSFWLL